MNQFIQFLKNVLALGLIIFLIAALIEGVRLNSATPATTPTTTNTTIDIPGTSDGSAAAASVAGADTSVTDPLRAHFMMSPRVASADIASDDPSTVEVTLKPGVTDPQALDLARRIKRYMRAYNPHPVAGEIDTVIVFRAISDDPKFIELDKELGGRSAHGTVRYMVEGDPDTGWAVVN